MEEVTGNKFNDLIQFKSIVKFGATWCGPCKSQDKVLCTFIDEKPGINVASIDVDSEPELASKYNIQSVPTIIAFDKGEEVKRLVGVQPLNTLKSIF